MYVRPGLLYLFYDKRSQIYHMIPDVPYFPMERGIFYRKRSIWREWTWRFPSFFQFHSQTYIILRFITTQQKSNVTYASRLYLLGICIIILYILIYHAICLSYYLSYGRLETYISVRRNKSISIRTLSFCQKIRGLDSCTPGLLYLFYDARSEMFCMVPDVPSFPIEMAIFYCRRSLWSDLTWRFPSFFSISD